MAGSDSTASDIFETYRRKLIGLPVSVIWRGHGSAIFLELDVTDPPDAKGRLTGRFSVMIEWSWRISSRTEILTGSWGEEETWPSHFKSLEGSIITDVTLFGTPPELAISLLNGFQVASFMTSEGSPEWTIFDASVVGQARTWISVENGDVVEDGNSL